MLTSPAWYWALPDNDDQPSEILNTLNAHTVGASVGRAALGLVLVPTAYWTCRATTAATLRAARAMLQH
jgi:hypothetical protein